MYMHMGMTHKEFWHGDPTLVIPYREAYKLNRSHENNVLWRQGRYIYDALCAVYPLFRFSFKGGELRPQPYVEEPYPITEEEVRARAKQKEKEAYEERLRLRQEQYARMKEKGR